MTRAIVFADAPIERHTYSSCRRSFMSVAWATIRAASRTPQAMPSTPRSALRWARTSEAVAETAASERTAVTLRTYRLIHSVTLSTCRESPTRTRATV